MLMLRRFAAACVVCVVAVPAVAAASQTGCVAGPAAEASSARPHIVDPVGDVDGVWPWGTEAYDIVNAWVSQEDQPPPGAPATFAVNISVADLQNHPVNVVYYARYTPTEWVSAHAMADGSWQFRWGNDPLTGPAFGAIRQPRGEVEGAVDVDAGVISLTLPSAHLPAARADGRQVDLDVLELSSGLALAAPLAADAPGILLTADRTGNADVCTVVLYPRRT